MKLTLRYPLLLGLIIALFIASYLLDSYRHQFLFGNRIEADVFYRVLGSLRELISTNLYLKANEYFHGGVVKYNYLACLEEEVSKPLKEKKHEVQNEEYHMEVHEYTCPPRHHGEHLEKIPIWNVLPYLSVHIEVSQHKHLHGAKEQEILPWFYYAVKIDPHNIDAYAVGGYWVAMRTGKIEEGIKFLREGITYNPDAWQLYFEMGYIYFRACKDWKRAYQFFKKAFELQNKENSTKYDRRTVLTFWAGCAERMGNVEEALNYYKLILREFPGNSGVFHRIEELKAKLSG